MSDEDNFYMQIVDLDEIYNFVVLSFFIWGQLNARKNNIKFQHHILSRDETQIPKNRKPFNMMSDEDNFYM